MNSFFDGNKSIFAAQMTAAVVVPALRGALEEL